MMQVHLPSNPIITMGTMEKSIWEGNVYHLDQGYYPYTDGTSPGVVSPGRFNDIVVKNTAGHGDDR